MSTLANKHITLGVGAGISAYRSLELIRLLKKSGAFIRVAPTKAALGFVTELTLETLSGQATLSDQSPLENGKINHIEEAYRSQLMVIAPATCDLLAKIANGFADTILLQTLLSFRGPLVLAPAMETNMWEHPATQANMALLKERGAIVVGPDTGELASGHHGTGRMASPEAIFDGIVSALSPKDFSKRRVLLSAGPTIEEIDPVRFLSNHSSGKMGLALARALVERGAEVHLVHGPLQVNIPSLTGFYTYPIKSADQMLDRVLTLSAHADLAILCAAVADYKPLRVADQKLKKSAGLLRQIELTENPDILATLGKRTPKPFLVGFAAETSDLESNAKQKCIDKNCDLICANLVNGAEVGFGADQNCVTLVDQKGVVATIGQDTKIQVAHRILDAVAARLSF